MAAAYIPYFFACMKYRGWYWKGISFFVLVYLMDALYDCGVYLRFFFHGPRAIREIMELDPKSSFGSIQSRLFMRHCAMIEIQKARGDVPKRNFTDMAMTRTFRNQFYDLVKRFKRVFGVGGYGKGLE